jgi:hypothetical protein
VLRSPPFPTMPGARANLTPGALYAVDGGDGFVYYGQIAENQQFGALCHRSEAISPEAALATEIMSRFSLSLPSVGRALRSGAWVFLGRHTIRNELKQEPILVQWPVGTTTVTLWDGSKQLRDTAASDPSIQNLEVIAAYDAIHHVPQRLRADFEKPADAWRAGGSVLRHRLQRQDLAARFPNQHQLPEDWVWAQ